MILLFFFIKTVKILLYVSMMITFIPSICVLYAGHGDILYPIVFSISAALRLILGYVDYRLTFNKKYATVLLRHGINKYERGGYGKA